MKHEKLPVPELFLPFFLWASSLGYGKFNQMFVNWYKDGNHYIGKHSDDEKQLRKDSPIVSVSLGATRKFRIRKKGEKGFRDILLPHGTVIVMGGKFQKEFTHEVPKIIGEKGKKVGPRINITFRQFVE
jgi:alkylated DNA repair dioxygenase AlkB